jgi:hypothetical protein
MDLTKDVIDRIIELAPTTVREVQGRTYADRDLKPVKDPLADSVRVPSLEALVKFLNWESKGGGPLVQTLSALVEGPDTVTVMGAIEHPWMRRPVVATAHFAEAAEFRFGQFLGQEEFVIGVQVGFVEDATTAALLKLVGTLEAGKVITAEDDGITQKVTASTGLARVGVVDLPNPVTLRPFRTFPEVEQPESKFIVRARSGNGDALPTVALFPVEDPRWTRDARQSIAAYLSSELPGLTLLA